MSLITASHPSAPETGAVGPKFPAGPRPMSLNARTRLTDRWKGFPGGRSGMGRSGAAAGGD